MSKTLHVGTIRLRDLKVPVGHDEGKGRTAKVHADRRGRRPNDKLRQELRGRGY